EASEAPVAMERASATTESARRTASVRRATAVRSPVARASPERIRREPRAIEPRTASLRDMAGFAVEFFVEIADGRCRARAEAEQVQAVHAQDRLVLAGGRDRDRRMAEDLLVGAARAGARHDHDDIRLGVDDGLVGERLVALEGAVRRVDRASKADDAVRGRV